MVALFVVEQGANVARRGERVAVLLGDVTMETARLDDLSQCVVFGNVTLSSPAVKAMLQRGVDVVFMNRGGGFVGRLTSGLSKNIDLRRRQFDALSHPSRQLELAMSCVDGKIENQRRLLARYQKRRPSPLLTSALVALRHAKRRLERVTDLNELRGVEGNAAAMYFSCWKHLIEGKGITFERRLRRPPPDPVNVLLSFGYTLLGNQIHAAVECAGLDPYLGGLHAPKWGRPSLVLDLIEEFRPVIVDTAVLRAINTGAVTIRDFQWLSGEDAVAERQFALEEYGESGEPSQDREVASPIVFLKSGIRKWLLEYERRLNESVHYEPRKQKLALRDVLTAQVYHLARCFESGDPYCPYLSPR